MSKRFQEYVAYEFIGGSRDGELIDDEEIKLGEGDIFTGLPIPTTMDMPFVWELYRVRGKKLLFEGYDQIA